MGDTRQATQAHDPPPPATLTQAPPTTFVGILRRLGPGLIIAGSIVGSGELIGTTKTGAEAGFWLLWLILIGCLIKVFAQVEFGRYTISTGRTTMAGLNEVPGPRLVVNWLVWYWLFIFFAALGQLGGIVGGVGQSMAMTFPLTGDFNQQLDVEQQQADFDRQLAGRHRQAGLVEPDAPAERRESLLRQLEAEVGKRPETPPAGFRYTYDDVYWSALITVVTALLLVIGRYGLIQNVSTVLVAGFTGVSIFCVIAQQSQPEWAVHWSDLAKGLSFQLPPEFNRVRALATAMATFGIIGVGANELIAYPYWCLEKGYAGFTGPRDDTPAWAERARGWMRVMRWDAWCSMLIYTFATVAFYLLGAGVLHRQGLNPSGNLMIRTLAKMYEPTFGQWAELVFLGGAFAVLYSTFFVAIAGHARVAADVLRLYRLGSHNERRFRFWVMLFCGLFPFCSLGIYMVNKDPVALVLLGGLSQALMLPMLGIAAMWFRYRRIDSRIAPGKLWDACLWVSFAGLLVAGCWSAFANFEKLKAALTWVTSMWS